jgi:hypothetical protein
MAGCHKVKKIFTESRIMKPLVDSIRTVSNTDGGIVLDLRRGAMFRVNPLGSRVLDLLAGGKSSLEIAEQISAEFEIALDRAQVDIAEFFSSLEAYGVLDPRWSRK